MSWMLVLICLCAAFIFSGIEAGLLSMNRVRLKHRVKLREKAALKLERLLEHPERLLVTVLIVTNLSTIMAVTLTAEQLVAIFGPRGYLITLLVFLPVYLFGVELLPKSLFRRFPYRAVSLLAEPLRVVDLLLTPLHVVGQAVSRLFGAAQDEPRKLFVAREDFKYLTIQTERAGSLTQVERQMIHGVVDFRAVTARDVMIPIEQAKMTSAKIDVAELISLARATGVDRWPVHTDQGTLSGLVNMLDVALSGRRTGPVEHLQRRIVKLSPNEPAYTVLTKLRAARSSMAAVLGPDGMPLGIVTWEDVVTRLVKSAGT